MFAMYALISFLAIGVGLLDIAQAVTCNLTPSYAAPVLANGWKAQLVATGLSDPRSVTFDRNGNLLVVQQGVGVVHLDFEDGGSTCLRVSKKTNLITASTLNHGIALSKDGNTLYASSSDAVV